VDGVQTKENRMNQASEYVMSDDSSRTPEKIKLISFLHEDFLVSTVRLKTNSKTDKTTFFTAPGYMLDKISCFIKRGFAETTDDHNGTVGVLDIIYLMGDFSVDLYSTHHQGWNAKHFHDP
jgi:hypothetical protein